MNIDAAALLPDAAARPLAVINEPNQANININTHRAHRCTICGNTGHNRRRCPTVVDTGEFYDETPVRLPKSFQKNSFSLLLSY
jgi:hypothetical protein